MFIGMFGCGDSNPLDKAKELAKEAGNRAGLHLDCLQSIYGKIDELQKLSLGITDKVSADKAAPHIEKLLKTLAEYREKLKGLGLPDSVADPLVSETRERVKTAIEALTRKFNELKANNYDSDALKKALENFS